MPYPPVAKLGVVCICLLACYATSFIGAVASINAADFYQQLSRPAWAPPGWLFGPVWMSLYTAMAIAAALVWLKNGFAAAKNELLLFFAHLIPNALWSWMFFAWQQGLGSIINIVILWAWILVLLVLFMRVNKLAGFLLLPYWLWVSFATALNWAMWRGNLGVF